MPAFVSLSTKQQNEKEIKDLHVLSPFSTSSVHVPRDISPQLCVVIKAQSLNPSVDVSRTLFCNKVDLVPAGDVRYICISPRRLDDNVIIDCTCSKYNTLFMLRRRQPSLSNVTRTFP